MKRFIRQNQDIIIYITPCSHVIWLSTSIRDAEFGHCYYCNETFPLHKFDITIKCDIYKVSTIPPYITEPDYKMYKPLLYNTKLQIIDILNDEPYVEYVMLCKLFFKNKLIRFITCPIKCLSSKITFIL